MSARPPSVTRLVGTRGLRLQDRSTASISRRHLSTGKFETFGMAARRTLSQIFFLLLLWTRGQETLILGILRSQVQVQNYCRYLGPIAVATIDTTTSSIATAAARARRRPAGSMPPADFGFFRLGGGYRGRSKNACQPALRLLVATLLCYQRIRELRTTRRGLMVLLIAYEYFHARQFSKTTHQYGYDDKAVKGDTTRTRSSTR